MANKNKRKANYRNQYTVHHKLPSSRNGTGCQENTEKIKATVHRGFHAVFGNELPDEQFVTLTRLNWSVYTEEAKEVFNEALIKILDLKKQKKLYNKKCCKNLKS